MENHEDFIDKQIENLGKKIKKLRKEKGYTNYEFFAYDNRINRSQYGKYEKGTDMRFSSLVRVLLAHKISLEDFFKDDFDKPQ